MNSALKPVLTSSSQNTAVTSSLSKPMHPQGTPTSYGQPTGHLTQTPYPNMNVAHNHPNAQANHYSINVANASTHYMGGSMGAIPPSNHPVANVSQSSGGQMYNPSKSVSCPSGYQPNLGHPPNQNAIPPISQTLPATSHSQQNTTNTLNTSTASSENPSEKPHSNGTPEVKSPPKTENQGNHASSKDKSPTPVPSQVPQISQAADKVVERSKPIPSVQEQKPPPESAKIPEDPKGETAGRIPAPVPAVTSDTSESSPVASGISNLQPETVSSPNKASESEDGSKTPSETDCKPVAPPSTIETKTVSVNEPISVPQETSERSAVPETDKDNKSNEPSENDKSSDKSASVDSDVDPLLITPTPATSKPKEQVSPKRDATPLKLATTPKTPTRKSKTPKPEESPKATKSETKTPIQRSPSTGKAKRQRRKTQPYQIPLPEIEIITKISSSTPRRSKNNDDKLIYFYKNEFLAVRNAEGGFYLCQAVQNIYKSSSKIKIRWLSQDKNDKSGEIYTPDFYDLTDFDCILTSIDLTRVDRGRYKLTPTEKERTDSILKRCLAVEKGEISTPSVSEEHPDGLDLSLYKDEEQLKKRKSTKRKGRTSSKSSKKEIATKKAPENAKVRKVEPKPEKKVVSRTTVTAKKAVVPEVKKATTTSRATRGKRRSDAKTSPVVDQKKAKVLAKIGRKTAIPASTSRLASTIKM
ncbi:hypothetical protein NQ315_010608 [Exocentrus adspersus]|uniref:Uncharacterized protein n=1 Tax=Exocentrus adspersus TaxID=1586481 RepID=A0AAV8W4V3_9CUCU|nr:hypothetical protein NQ315_010608 [Exocentrus adspersus]